MNRKKIITKQMKKFLKIFKPFIEEKIGVSANQRIAEKSMHKLEKSYDDMPDIGMDMNAFQKTMDFAFIVHIIYENLLMEDLSMEQIGDIIYYGFKTFIDNYPSFIMKIMKRKQFSKKHIAYMRELARYSKTRDHIFNWVFDIVDGNGKDFEWGIDYKRCGINDFFRENNQSEIMPYICATDHCMFVKMKAGMKLDKALGRGDDCCNFRYKRNGETESDLKKIIKSAT